MRKFPYPWEQERLRKYDLYEKLFMGEHFDAFMIQIDNELYGKNYARLKYLVANFAGLISKVSADLLFIEPPKIEVKDGDQEWVDNFLEQNNFRVLMYESALEASYFGDTCFKLRVDKLNPTDEKNTVVLAGQSPLIYFPTLNPNDIKGEPLEKELAWVIKIAGKNYLRKEIHRGGFIYNELYELSDKPGAEGFEIVRKAELSLLGQPGLLDSQDTKIKSPMLFHVPNWRAGNRYFGISDYFDLMSLFYAINNRISKVDNILDKHSDPILAIPAEVLDEDGNVKKSAIGTFVRADDGGKENDPSYITWEANLESAFKEIDHLVEMIFMMSETAPGILGMDKNGQAESGRALKLKLLRTLYKIQRKQLYYTRAIKEMVYSAQLLGKAWDVEVKGQKLKGDPVMPDVIWRDGLPADMAEMIDNETKALDAGITTTVDAIMRVYDVDRKSAEQMKKEIDKETELSMPVMNTAANANTFKEDMHSPDASPKDNPPIPEQKVK